jgi:hypothetical protein
MVSLLSRDEEMGELRAENQRLRESLAYKDHRWDAMRHDRDRIRRLFDKLEHAITFHKRDEGEIFASNADLKLWKDHRKIMTEYANGSE